MVGAVSFDPDTPDVLWEPERLEVEATSDQAAPPGEECDGGSAVCTRSEPTPADHLARVEQVVGLIRAGVAQKVVLGRSEHLAWERPITPEQALRGFTGSDNAGSGYLVDLTDGWLVGSSPELLISRSGREIHSFPLAGTCARQTVSADDELDDSARALLDSAKDLDEHAYVTRALAEALGPWCDELDIPDTPSLVGTPTTWHLGTPITGRLREAGPDGQLPTVLDLVALVHPTPALCGTPTDRAMDVIRAVEGRGARGMFGGAVGWCDEDGDGEFRVTIRGAVLAADGLGATVWAGGGLTTDSDPQAELAETTTKLERARRVFGAGVNVA